MRTAVDTLDEAVALCAALEPDARRSGLLAVASAARALGHDAVADAVALQLDSAAYRLQERALRLDAALRASPAPDAPRLRALAAAVRAALRADGPWRADRLTHPDDARVWLCAADARLADDQQLDETLAGFVVPTLHALGWAVAAAGSWGHAPERAEALGYHAVTLAVRAEDPVIERRVVGIVAEGALRVGRPGAALAPLKALANLGVAGLRWAEAALVVARCCAEHDELGVGGATLQRAAQAAEAVEGAHLEVTAFLCKVAEAQRRHLGPTLARTTAQRVVDRLRGHMLGPEPNLRLPYRPLLVVSLANPALAAPLRDLLRAQSVVSPGWCFALGLLEHGTGALDRARQAARVLEESAASGANDVEALWLAGLLRARIGDASRARVVLVQALGALPSGAVIDVPGSPGGDCRAERVFVDALLAVGDIEGGLLVARLTPTAGLRAGLLLRCADALRLAGAGSDVRAALDEATAALAEDDPQAIDPDLMLDLMWSRAMLGQVQAAADLFAWERARLAVRGGAAAALVVALERLGGRCGAAVDAALAHAWEEELALATHPAERLGLLLSWLDLQRASSWPAGPSNSERTSP